MNINRPSLESHLVQKNYNYGAWLETIEDSASFPYAPNQRPGKLLEREITPLNPPNGLMDLQNEAIDRPAYVATIPFVPPKQEARLGQKVVDLLEKLRDEAFGANPIASRQVRRLSVVLFANRLGSLDSANNLQMAHYIQNLPIVEGIAYRVFGTFWMQEWEKKNRFSALTYPKETAFCLLKMLKPEAAIKVIEAYESGQAISSKIPYQHIRERLKNHAFTAGFADPLRGLRPVYLSVMDDDIVSLRQGVGLFSHYDAIAATRPQVMSTGYWANPNTYPIVRLGMKLDMKVRAALSTVIPMAPYYPEPNLHLLLEHPLSSYSFLGKGTHLESRRLLENGIARGILQPARMVFRAERSLVTTDPERMHPQTVTGVAAVNAANLGQKKILKALRGLSQVHFFPKMWGDQVYLALPVTAGRMTDITKPLMTLFTCFDPINLAYSYSHNSYTKTHFTALIAIYPHFARFLEQALLGLLPFEDARNAFSGIVNDPLKQAALQVFFTAHFQRGLEASTALGVQGLNEEWRSNVIRAACASGTAMRTCFEEILRGGAIDA